MKFSKDTTVRMFSALGFKLASKWDVDRLGRKLTSLPSLVDADTKTDDEEINSLIAKALEAVKNGDTLVIGDVDDVTPEPKKEKPKPKEEPKPEAKEDPKPKEEAKKEEAKPAGKRVTITNKIIELVTNATAEDPISKEQIVKELEKVFPEKDPMRMMSTVMTLVPSDLRKYWSLNIYKNEKGYWARPMTSDTPATTS